MNEQPDMNELLDITLGTIDERIYYHIGPRHKFRQGQVIYEDVETECSTFLPRLDEADIRALIIEALEEPTSVPYAADKHGKEDYIGWWILKR